MGARAKLKPLSEQVVVLTGATSGIGLTTVRRAAEEGAKLVFASRDEDALQELAAELRQAGAEVEPVVADVGDEAQVRRVAEVAVERFGGFDTWVNVAGTSVYAPLTETPMDEHRRVFETNYWGVVHGSLAAVEHLRGREGGGTLINIGSVLSDMSIPVQGAYVASKHAVKGFTNSLRQDLIRDRAPVNVVLIKPSGIDTPFVEHAANHEEAAPRVPPPVYDPEIVADAILYAAQHRTRDIVVGSAGKSMVLFSRWAPKIADRVYARLLPELQKDRRFSGRRPDNLDEPQDDLSERSYTRFTRKHSLYTAAQTHPGWFLAGGVVFGALAAGLVARKAGPEPVRRLLRG